MNNIQKLEAINALGSVGALAELLGITPQAIYLWPDNEPIPIARQWQLRAMRPDVFGPQASAPAGEAGQEVRDAA